MNSDSQSRILSRNAALRPADGGGATGRSRPPIRHDCLPLAVGAGRFATSWPSQLGLSSRWCQKNWPVRNHVLFLLSHRIQVGRSKAIMPFHMFFLVTPGSAGLSITPTFATSKNGMPIS